MYYDATGKKKNFKKHAWYRFRITFKDLIITQSPCVFLAMSGVSELLPRQ